MPPLLGRSMSKNDLFEINVSCWLRLQTRRAHLGLGELLRELDKSVANGRINSTDKRLDQRSEIDVFSLEVLVIESLRVERRSATGVGGGNRADKSSISSVTHLGPRFSLLSILQHFKHVIDGRLSRTRRVQDLQSGLKRGGACRVERRQQRVFDGIRSAIASRVKETDAPVRGRPAPMTLKSVGEEGEAIRCGAGELPVGVGRPSCVCNKVRKLVLLRRRSLWRE